MDIKKECSCDICLGNYSDSSLIVRSQRFALMLRMKKVLGYYVSDLNNKQLTSEEKSILAREIIDFLKSEGESRARNNDKLVDEAQCIVYDDLAEFL